jgi:hypothetical protein
MASATNPQTGVIKMEIDGKAYTLVLNTNVMATLEEHFSTPEKDVSWDEIFTRVLRGSVKHVRALIWAMLLQHHPTLTVEQVGVLIDKAGGFEGLTHIIQGAAKSSTPDPKDVKELGVRPRKAGRRGTGGGSTSTRGASA